MEEGGGWVTRRVMCVGEGRGMNREWGRLRVIECQACFCVNPCVGCSWWGRGPSVTPRLQANLNRNRNVSDMGKEFEYSVRMYGSQLC